MPCSSPDKALTAFCQLGALRIGTRRSMLFFFDESYAYILAEATQTLSLEDDSKHEIDDSLWLGHTVIPRGFSVCEHTVRMDISSLSEVEDPPQIHIINDLRESTRFCDRPFVTGGPKARFYAGVPITTPNSINIGAYCVLDDKPRDGLARKDIVFLREMANTIMTHLNMARAKDEQRRGLKMVHALSRFVDDAHGSSERNARGIPDRLNKHRPSLAELDLQQEQMESSADHGSPTNSEMAQIRRSSKTSQLSSSPSRHSQAPIAQDHIPAFPASTETDPIRIARESDRKLSTPGSASHDYGVHTDHRDVIPKKVRATFQRAADLVMGATEVDGTLFLDASRITVRGPVPAGDVQGENHLDFGQTTDPSPASEAPAPFMATEECVVLGASGEPPRTHVTNGFLGSLLEKYRNGKIWSFDENLLGASGDETTDEPEEKGSSKDGRSLPALRKDRKDEARQHEIDEIQRLFPGVRNLAIRGLWDETTARWSAACITWTNSPLRVLSASEMNYIAAFCDVIMAEVKRQEAQASDKAKTDFISSISHELRSPLHGILGSVECIQEQVEPSSYTKELEQIESCGRTLLDIVDHLLDASMISFNKAKAASGLSRFGKPKTRSALNSDATVTGLRGISEDVSLAKVTEETVDSVIYAFSCRKDKQELLCHQVRVTMSIHDFNKPRWNVNLLTGAYRRVVINLVSNALKYTEAGYVSITLRAEDLPNDPTRFNAVLEVRDSGRGMSQEYLQNSAFRAFSQEDSFVEGTGLGLNLVANILKQLGGKIDIQSEKNVGTRVAVTIPLMYATSPLVERRPSANSVFDVGNVATKPIQTAREEVLSHHGIENAVGPAAVLASFRNGLAIPTAHNSDSISNTTLMASVHDAEKRSDQSRPVPIDGRNQKPGFDSTKQIGATVGFALAEFLGTGQSEDSKTRETTALMEASVLDTCMQIGLHLREQKGDLQSMNTDLIIMSESEALRVVQCSISDMVKAPLSSRPVIIVTRTAQSERLLKSQPVFAAQLTTAHVEYVRSYWVLGLAKAIQQCASSMQKQRLPDQVTTTPLYANGIDADLTSKPTITATLQALSLYSASSADGSDPTTSGSKPVKSEVAAEAQPQQDLCVLIVDDNPINVQILSTYVRKQKYSKLEASNGEEAVRVYKSAYHPGAESAPPKHKIILLDINMPVMDGYEAARRIRHHEQKYGLAPAIIIALTGLGSAAAQQEAFDSGMDLFLTKPVSLRELKRLIGDIRAGTLQ
nr:hybrid signal transduction histidine kinase b [Quercus suber]